MSRPEESLRSLQEMLRSIYNEHNREFYDDKDLLLRINEEVSKVDKLVRKENTAGMIDYLPRLFAWAVAFPNRVGIDISAALWEKYPRICPYCLTTEHCRCISLRDIVKYIPDRPELVEARKSRENMPQTLTDWQEVIATLYKRVNSIQALTAVWLHVSEEVGEVSEAYRKKRNDNLREEQADEMAWILSTATKLGVNLQDLVLSRYPGRCDVCKQEKCQCEVI